MGYSGNSFRKLQEKMSDEGSTITKAKKYQGPWSVLCTYLLYISSLANIGFCSGPVIRLIQNGILTFVLQIFGLVKDSAKL